MPQKPQPSIAFAYRHVKETHVKPVNKIITFTVPWKLVPTVSQFKSLGWPKQGPQIKLLTSASEESHLKMS